MFNLKTVAAAAVLSLGVFGASQANAWVIDVTPTSPNGSNASHVATAVSGATIPTYNVSAYINPLYYTNDPVDGWGFNVSLTAESGDTGNVWMTLEDFNVANPTTYGVFWQITNLANPLDSLVWTWPGGTFVDFGGHGFAAGDYLIQAFLFDSVDPLTGLPIAITTNDIATAAYSGTIVAHTPVPAAALLFAPALIAGAAVSRRRKQAAAA